MALAKTAAKQPSKAEVQAAIDFQTTKAAHAKKATAKKASRQPRSQGEPLEVMAVKEWVQNTDFLRLGIDLYTGRLIGYGTYAELNELYQEQNLYEKLCLNVGEADDADTYMRLHEGILRVMAVKLGVVNAHTRPRDELAVACALDVQANGWLPALDADLALNLEELRLQPDPPSSMLSLPERKTESIPTQQGDTPMALAKAKETPAKPAKAAKAPAGKPAASPKPAPAAKAADKPASPKPAAAKPANPKPAAAAKPAAKAPAAAKAPRAEAVEQNGIKAPLDMTGKCGRVWVACDKKLKELKGKPTFTSADIVASLPDENEGNVRLETSRWAKFHGHALPRAPRAAKAE